MKSNGQRFTYYLKVPNFLILILMGYNIIQCGNWCYLGQVIWKTLHWFIYPPLHVSLIKVRCIFSSVLIWLFFGKQNIHNFHNISCLNTRNIFLANRNVVWTRKKLASHLVARLSYTFSFIKTQLNKLYLSLSFLTFQYINDLLLKDKVNLKIIISKYISCIVFIRKVDN